MDLEEFDVEDMLDWDELIEEEDMLEREEFDIEEDILEREELLEDMLEREELDTGVVLVKSNVSLKLCPLAFSRPITLKRQWDPDGRGLASVSSAVDEVRRMEEVIARCPVQARMKRLSFSADDASISVLKFTLSVVGDVRETELMRARVP